MTHAIAFAPVACAGSAASCEQDLRRLSSRVAAVVLAAALAVAALSDRSAAGSCFGTGITTADINLPGPIGRA